MIVNGQEVRQGLVFWEHLGTGEDPSNVHRRVLGRWNKHKGGGRVRRARTVFQVGEVTGSSGGSGPTGLNTLRKSLSNCGNQPKEVSQQDYLCLGARDECISMLDSFLLNRRWSEAARDSHVSRDLRRWGQRDHGW